MQAAGQVDTGGDVAPLIGAADLQGYAVQLVQAGEIIALQQVIGELGKGDALVVAVQALLHRFLVDHLVNGEVLADIAQEGQHVHAAEPVVVVCRNGRVAAAVKIEEWRNLLADLRHPLLDGLLGIKLAFRRFKARIANQTGGTAHQRNRLMARFLEALQAQQGNEMPQMQAVSGGIEAAIECDRALRQSLC